MAADSVLTGENGHTISFYEYLRVYPKLFGRNSVTRLPRLSTVGLAGWRGIHSEISRN